MSEHEGIASAAFFLEKLDYWSWANRRVAASLATFASPPGKAILLFSHIVAAQNIWLARIIGESIAFGVWEERSLAEIESDIAASYKKWREFLESLPHGDEDKIISYRMLDGTPEQNSLEEILEHLSFHAAYHRGQIAALVREAGGSPAATDYILFARDRRKRRE